MIAMGVGDEDGVERAEVIEASCARALVEAPRGEARVDQDPGAARLDEEGVPLTSAREDGESHDSGLNHADGARARLGEYPCVRATSAEEFPDERCRARL